METPRSLFALRSRTIVTPGGILDGYLVVRDQRIQAITTQVPDGIPVDDVGSASLLPGLVDPHVHINEPGRADWEGFESGTRAALSGGICLLVDMPLNSAPVTIDEFSHAEKVAAMSGKLFCDVALYGGAVPGNVPHMAGLAKAGVLGFKSFMVDSGLPEFSFVDPVALDLAAQKAAELGLPLLVHAERSVADAPSLISTRSYSDYLSSRPEAMETTAVAEAIELSAKYGTRLHIVHVSSAACLPLIEAAKHRGLSISAETCPQYLCVVAEDIPDGAVGYKCAPPIRDHENREALWQGLKTGILDCIATDHSPAPPEVKALNSGDFAAAWGGIASLGFSFQLVWTQAKQRGFSLADMARWFASNPAKLVGCENAYGSLAIGRPAHIAVIDSEAQAPLNPTYSKHAQATSPFYAQLATGVVQAVYLAGTKAFWRGSDATGSFTAPAGHFIRRT